LNKNFALLHFGEIYSERGVFDMSETGQGLYRKCSDEELKRVYE